MNSKTLFLLLAIELGLMVQLVVTPVVNVPPPLTKLNDEQIEEANFCQKFVILLNLPGVQPDIDYEPCLCLDRCLTFSLDYLTANPDQAIYDTENYKLFLCVEDCFVPEASFTRKQSKEVANPITESEFYATLLSENFDKSLHTLVLELNKVHQASQVAKAHTNGLYFETDDIGGMCYHRFLAGTTDPKEVQRMLQQTFLCRKFLNCLQVLLNYLAHKDQFEGKCPCVYMWQLYVCSRHTFWEDNPARNPAALSTTSTIASATKATEAPSTSIAPSSSSSSRWYCNLPPLMIWCWVF